MIKSLIKGLLKQLALKVLGRDMIKTFYDDCMAWDFIAIALPSSNPEEFIKYSLIMPVAYTLSDRQ